MRIPFITFLFVVGMAPGIALSADVVIRSGEVRLAATLLMPEVAEPAAGVVTVHGSGPSTRTWLNDHAAAMNEIGLAVLLYDKRGAGQSSGDWTSSSLDDLAADAVAAANWLSRQPGVDPARIGFWGISQGGWVLPEAAARFDAAFLVVVTGGGLDPEVVERYQYRRKLEHQGASARDIAAAEELLDVYFDYLADGSRHGQLMQMVERYSSEEWFGWLGLSRVLPKPVARPAWSWVSHLHAVDRISALRMPVLVLLGELDPLQPLEPTVAAWRENLHVPAVQQVIVVENAGHGLREDPHGGELIPAFRTEARRWLDETGIIE